MCTALLGLVLTAGCIGTKKPVYDQPPFPIAGESFSLVWVEPRVVASDSLYTLIAAQRLDSLPVTDGATGARLPSEVHFAVPAGGCIVLAELRDDRGRPIVPLLARHLDPGYYKLTCYLDRIDPPITPSGRYVLGLEYCGHSIVEQLIRE